jgi:hypothetical protein
MTSNRSDNCVGGKEKNRHDTHISEKDGLYNRPPIKNNLNKQLKIYYAYRVETTKDRFNNTENRPLSP